jgi:hypothetical protein
MSFKIDGKYVMQSGAIFRATLRKLMEGCRIAAWGWARDQENGAERADRP